MTELKIKGHSGCRLSVYEAEDGQMTVKKSCDADYLPRLHKQYVKQLYAFKHGYTNINVPKPEWVHDKHMTMPYIHAQSYVEYLECATVHDIKKFADKMIGFINEELDDSAVKEVSATVFTDKIKSVADKCKENKLVMDTALIERIYIDQLMDNALRLVEGDVISMPIGACHGDLTLSNILFTESGVYLIDWLDSFIESPLIDIAKLRQDTCWKWSAQMATTCFNEPHINTALDYLDRRIMEELSSRFSPRLMLLIEYLNMFRILPYCKDEITTVTVLSNLIKMTKQIPSL